MKINANERSANEINANEINDWGVLYIVATPIGNLKDMSLRAIDVLQSVDFIAAEDTRHSASLLQHFLIKTPTISLHDYNERERAAEIIAKLKQGKNIALISDAGTPLISDPGYFLVHELRNVGIRVVPIPGACAAIAALSASGLPTDRFIFEGFLPAKGKSRTERMEALKNEPRTIIFYEAPHRILNFLKDLQSILGDERRVVMARELTKLYETIQAGTLAELVIWVEKDANQQRGEIVVLVEGIKQVIAINKEMEILKVLLLELPLKKAVELAAQITGERKNHLYQLALQIKAESL